MHVLFPLHGSAERHFGPSLVSFFYGGVLNLDIEMRVMHSQRGKPCGWVEEALKKEKEEEHSVDTVQRAKLQ